MAEIGLIASVFTVATFGTSVATTLYEAADVMINAHQQIFALAKHVSQFTAVLKHMGKVLESEKSNCSKEVLRDIRKIKHSCKRTFKEINITVKSKRFRHFGPVRWLFKRTKAMELEARLDSHQSMLQCIIHTLTVSKLGHIDARSKQDSQHITGLKEEINLLKTFIMESYNNLTELRRAEESIETERRFQPMSGGNTYLGVQNPYRDDSTLSHNPMGGWEAYEPPIPRPPMPTSNACGSQSGDSSSDDGVDDNSDANSTNSQEQRDQGHPGSTGDTSNTERLIPGLPSGPRLPYDDVVKPRVHRESNLLLQIVPYKPISLYPGNSDRLILGGHGAASESKSTKGGATDSVRLLLEKWTTSGAAPVSDILDEEAAKEKKVVELAEERRASDPSFETFRPLSPRTGHVGDDFTNAYYPGLPEYPRIQPNQMPPPPPPLHGAQPESGYPFYNPSISRRKDFWKQSHPSSQSPGSHVGDDILTALRSTRGGIYYTKSNRFEQVHYVDQCPIYTCAFVPSHMIPHNERQYLNTELSRGAARKEALDLLGYAYTETEAGNFSISGDLGLREIEELVRLSYQALDRASRERSKATFKERNLDEAYDALNPVPGIYPSNPPMGPQYPPTWGPWNHSRPTYGGYAGHRSYADHEPIRPNTSVPFTTPSPFVQTNEPCFIGGDVRPPPAFSSTKGERQEENGTESARPEVRFTLPRLDSGARVTGNEARKSPAKSDVPGATVENRLKEARQKLENINKRKEAAEKAKDSMTAADLTYYAIPDLEVQIKELEMQQREEEEKQAASKAQSNGNQKPQHTEVKTESESSDDEDASD